MISRRDIEDRSNVGCTDTFGRHDAAIHIQLLRKKVGMEVAGDLFVVILHREPEATVRRKKTKRRKDNKWTPT